MEPIHKFNNGSGATLCHSCSTVINTGLTEHLLCPKCQESALELLKESVYFMNKVPNNKYGDNYSICSEIDKLIYNIDRDEKPTEN